MGGVFFSVMSVTVDAFKDFLVFVWNLQLYAFFYKMNVNMRDNYINDDQYKEWNCYILCSVYYSYRAMCWKGMC